MAHGTIATNITACTAFFLMVFVTGMIRSRRFGHGFGALFIHAACIYRGHRFRRCIGALAGHDMGMQGQ
jgi:hypothetical protein